MRLQAYVPMAVQIVIDDVGWWSGKDDHETGGPYRTGMLRDHTIEDYRAIIELGQRLSIRPQAAMIIGEWDRTNVLRRIPSATPQGEAWDNRRWVGPWLDEAAELFRRHDEFIELTLHGLYHEYWQDGQPTRAEWFDPNGRMRPESDVRAHLDAFAEILEQNGLGPLPRSFVPPAYRYRFRSEEGFADILAEYGIRYLTTVFNRKDANHSKLVSPWFGFDSSLIAVEWGAALGDTGRSVLPWYTANPQVSKVKSAEGPVLGLHWPNLLHLDPARNGEVIEQWVAYLRQFEHRPDRMLARNTEEGYAQLMYYTGTDVTVAENVIHLDFTRLDSWSVQPESNAFTLKMVADRPPLLEASDGSLTIAAPSPDKTEAHGVYSFAIERRLNEGERAPRSTLTVRLQ
ncbi:MAG: hypothetical protein K0Q59_1977 [Paenibacillus sp.]|nr:hypothetical protein [Paenibacillus sp.]